MVTHVMSDGTKRDSIKGLVVSTGHPVYRVLQKMQEEGMLVENTGKVEKDEKKVG